MFESTSDEPGQHAGGTDRYHLTLTTSGRITLNGWWASESAARAKAARWTGDWGRPDTRVYLVDTETGETLTDWPEVP
ncbi:hypothetical protein [Streptomyces sp. NPDC101249]|uniref:hypothetical protein n=1 Tax=Streptomyces sp. NPDC101249 TaxID=3366140 RepID=UPI0038234BA9